MKAKYVIFLLLLAFCCCTSETRRVHLGRVLDCAQQQNFDYDSITNVDSIALVAEFFDRHGTPNEQMRAYYLLGCAYRDMGEAPAALQSYQDAVGRADTLSSDCDLAELSRVYGQSAAIFYQHSGYFDSQGNITKGRVVYYNAKGLFYLKKNMLDSA